nr:GNAT family N-acetyltransferase [Nocardioides sp. zg-DK7169]
MRGRHAPLARRRGRALAYRPDVATFVAVPPRPERADWDDLAALLGSGGFADLFSAPVRPPAGWEPVFAMAGVQMVGPTAVPPVRDADVVRLGTADVPEMLALVDRTHPGPFWERTVEMGTYVGVRDAGRLVAMAGERLRPPGWTEISAVCTAPEAQGRGHASRLVRHLVGQVLARGERPFLHASEDNRGAIELYERLGFTLHRRVTFHGHRVP